MQNFDAARIRSKDAGWPVVMRRSGGSAVAHRPGILNISRRRLLPPESRHWMASGYEDFLNLLEGALGRMDVPCDHGAVPGAHCDGRFNLRCRGRKLAGTAAYAGAIDGQRYCVFHASIVVSGPLDCDLAAIESFERDLGLVGSYDRAAHVSLTELVAADAVRAVRRPLPGGIGSGCQIVVST
jgi:lipoate-protein ligase A